MTRLGIWGPGIWGLAFAAACGPAPAQTYGAPPPDLNAKLDKLVRSYPQFLASHDGTWLVLRDGRRFAISDGKSDKTFDRMIEHADIDDMFYAAYPAGAEAVAPASDADPGRVRFEPLFDAMYGDCERGEVAPKLRSIPWLPKHGGGHVAITTANGVDKALEAVSAELDALPERFVKYLVPNSGTYNCRKIAGSSARSVHAWAAAIDINSAASDYWRWSKDGWHNRIPIEIARVFERHGFIWGGRWYHYDTMHFEYRPELLP
ncbi:MAG: M15 family metallopeptidase [Rhizomicrobium sp.]